MNDPIPDRTVISIIVATILLIFMLIFTFTSGNKEVQPGLEWRENTGISADYIKT